MHVQFNGLLVLIKHDGTRWNAGKASFANHGRAGMDA